MSHVGNLLITGGFVRALVIAQTFERATVCPQGPVLSTGYLTILCPAPQLCCSSENSVSSSGVV